MTKIETELKFKIENPQEILKKLEDAEFVGSKFQRTIRFEDGTRLKDQGMFLRVRSGFKNVITLKSKIKDDTKEIYRREEIEFEIEDIESMRKIINKLGFTKEMIMEKYRTKFNYLGCEVVIDELPFGTYLEIEGEEGVLFSVAETLGLDKKDNINYTYWDVFEKYKEDNDLQSLGDNMVFPEGYEQKFIIR